MGLGWTIRVNLISRILNSDLIHILVSNILQERLNKQFYQAVFLYRFPHIIPLEGQDNIYHNAMNELTD